MWQWWRRRADQETVNGKMIDPATIDRLVNLAGPHIRLIDNYREKLGPLIAEAMQKTRDLGERLPKPVELSAEHWRNDRLLSLVFANPERMAEIVSANEEISNWFTEHPLADSACAVLGVTRSVQTRYGMEEQNGIVRQDVLQQVLVFRDHRFGSLVENEAALSRQAQCRALEELAHHAARRISGLESEKTLIEDEINTLRIALRLGGPTDPLSASPMQRQRLSRLDFLTRELAVVRQSLAPEAQLETLMASLRAPEQELRFNQAELRVDRMGVLRQNDPEAHTITLFEIEMIDNEPVCRTLLPVIIPRTLLRRSDRSDDPLFCTVHF